MSDNVQTFPNPTNLNEYQKLIGCLTYVTTATRPDLCSIRLRRLLNNVGEKQEQPSIMNEDNQGAIELSRNPKFYSRNKHIDVAYHFVREKVNDKSINVKYCSTDQM